MNSCTKVCDPCRKDRNHLGDNLTFIPTEFAGWLFFAVSEMWWICDIHMRECVCIQYVSSQLSDHLCSVVYCELGVLQKDSLISSHVRVVGFFQPASISLVCCLWGGVVSPHEQKSLPRALKANLSSHWSNSGLDCVMKTFLTNRRLCVCLPLSPSILPPSEC